MTRADVRPRSRRRRSRFDLLALSLIVLVLLPAASPPQACFRSRLRSRCPPQMPLESDLTSARRGRQQQQPDEHDDDHDYDAERQEDRPEPATTTPYTSLASPPAWLPSSFKRARTASISASSDLATPPGTNDHSDIDAAEGAAATAHGAYDASGPATNMTDAGHIGNLRLEDEGGKTLDSQPSREQQLATITALKQQPLQVGQSWYPIPRSWFQTWGTACTPQQGTDSPLPTTIPPLDCSELGQTNDPSLLSHDIEEDRHYVLVPEQAFDFIVQWYGLSDKSPTFKRQVVSVDGSPPILELHVPRVIFPLVTAAANATATLAEPVAISRATNLYDVKLAAMHALNLNCPADDVRLWCVPPTLAPRAVIAPGDVQQGAATSGEYQLVSPERMSSALGPLIDRPLSEPFPLAVEQRGDNDGSSKWPTETAAAATLASSSSSPPRKGIFAPSGNDHFDRLQRSSATSPPAASTSTSASASSQPQPLSAPAPPARVTRSQAPQPGRTRGLKGLGNLGNTCFMNSALQCLSNTPELKDYFVSRVFEQEINQDNPLGNQGALAEAFGNLVQSLWSGQGTSLVPRDFKWALSRFAPQFSGYSQQDTQELLAFLLDGLHEDLNRIKKKPYIEAPDWEGGGLEEMVRFAKRQWEIYKMRNDSVIVDLFQGQYRSTLVCPECSKVSIKFDPFMYLTLPLPNMSLWRHQIVYVPYDPTKPMEHINMALPQETSFAKFKQSLGEMHGVPPKRLLAAEYWSHKIYKFYADYEPVHIVEKNDVCVVWELPCELPPPAAAPANHNSRYYSTSPVGKPPRVEEKVGTAPAQGWQDDEQIVLPVYTHALGGTRDAVGWPFFVLIQRNEMSDVRAIRAAVAKQYARFVERHDELISAIDGRDAVAASGAAASDANAWQVVESGDVSTDSDMSVDTVVGGDDDDAANAPDVVTEIRADGQIIESSDYRPQQTRTHPPPPPVVQMLSDGGGDAVAGDSAAASAHSPVALPFDLAYMVNTAPSRPILKETESWPHLGEDLDQRAQRLANEGSDLPIVYRGGALVAIWTQEAAAELLPNCEDSGRWGSNCVEVDDPRVAAEKKSQTAGARRKAKQTLNIEDCLDEFTKEEQLGEEDPWYCPQCKEFRQATKKFDLWKVPDILVVHLKRFSAGRGLRDKIDAVVDFPLEGFDLSDRVEGAKAVQQLRAEGKLEGLQSSFVLDSGAATPATASASSDDNGGSSSHQQDLSASILSAISEANDDAVAADQPIYDLFAVDNHYGGLGGGHYTTSAKNADDDKWYYFDDSSVRPLGSGEEVKGSAAYLLFYRRRTTRPIGGKSREIVKSHVAAAEAAAAGADAAGDDSMRTATTSGSVTLNENYDSSDDDDDGMGTSRFPLRSGGGRGFKMRDSDDDDDRSRTRAHTPYHAHDVALASPPLSIASTENLDWSPPQRVSGSGGGGGSPASPPSSSSPPLGAAAMPGAFSAGAATDAPMRGDTPPPPYDVSGSVVSPDATVETIPLDEADMERHTKEHSEYYRAIDVGVGGDAWEKVRRGGSGELTRGSSSPRSDVAADGGDLDED